MSDKYKESGVDILKGYETVKRIKNHANKTNNLGFMANIGAFGGLFDLSKYQLKKPVLVSGTDGVGTKLLIAQEARIHDTIGIDLVAMCVNDIITVLAKPLFFLDYVALGKLEPEIVEQIIEGISKGCLEAGCALIGGETAEMPDMYEKNHYDLAGFATGVVEKDQIPNINQIQEGNVLIGIASSGLHSNGYTLVRKILFKDHHYQLQDYIEELGKTIQDELLEPTKIYVKAIEAIQNEIKVHGISHITGGGFLENIPRSLPENLGVVIKKSSFRILPIFSLLERLGNIPHQEMFNIFNMGIGMVVIIDKEDSSKVIDLITKAGFTAYEIGYVTSAKGVFLQ
jgi:phosphoribosylformylglycinamidine cyclo-ligase